MTESNELKVNKKKFEDFMQRNSNYICNQCGMQFTFPAGQKTINQCPFCKIDLSLFKPQISENNIEQPKQFVKVIKDKKGTIVNIIPITKEEYEKTKNEQDKISFITSLKKINSDWASNIIHIVVISEKISCAISKILKTIAQRAIQDDMWNNRFDVIHVLASDMPEIVDTNNTMLPQLAIVYNNEILKYIPIKQLNEDTLKAELITIDIVTRSSQSQ